MSTLALDGSSDAPGSTRIPPALRYGDLVLLAAGLPVFIAVGLPMAGYAVLAAVWLVQHGIELGAERSAARAMADGNRNAALGWIAASTLGRVWIVTISVLLVGLLASKDAGLAAAVLAVILFTVHLGGRVLGRLLAPPDETRGG